MPRAKIKSLEEVDPIISEAYRKAFANPGATVVVAPNVAPNVAINLQVRMRAVRQGFLTLFPKEHEYHRAALYGRLWIEREYDHKSPGTRTVILRYSGMIKRPSEVAAEYMASLQKEYTKQLQNNVDS